jgi:hypothetical protein
MDHEAACAVTTENGEEKCQYPEFYTEFADLFLCLHPKEGLALHLWD